MAEPSGECDVSLVLSLFPCRASVDRVYCNAAAVMVFARGDGGEALCARLDRGTGAGRVLELPQLAAGVLTCALSASGRFALVALGNGDVVAVYSGQERLLHTVVAVRQLVQVIRFPDAGPDGDMEDCALLGTLEGYVYALRLSYRKRLMVEQNQLRVVQVLPHPVTGLDFYSFEIHHSLQSTSQFIGASPCSSCLDINQKPVDYMEYNALGYGVRPIRRYFVIISTPYGIKLIEGRGMYVADVLLASQRQNGGAHQQLDYQYTHIIPNG